jgi:hypothetical protein
MSWKELLAESDHFPKEDDALITPADARLSRCGTGSLRIATLVPPTSQRLGACHG